MRRMTWMAAVPGRGAVGAFSRITGPTAPLADCRPQASIVWSPCSPNGSMLDLMLVKGVWRTGASPSRTGASLREPVFRRPCSCRDVRRRGSLVLLLDDIPLQSLVETDGSVEGTICSFAGFDAWKIVED
jgi:hypothetical protein